MKKPTDGLYSGMSSRIALVNWVHFRMDAEAFTASYSGKVTPFVICDLLASLNSDGLILVRHKQHRAFWSPTKHLQHKVIILIRKDMALPAHRAWSGLGIILMLLTMPMKLAQLYLVSCPWNIIPSRCQISTKNCNQKTEQDYSNYQWSLGIFYTILKATFRHPTWQHRAKRVRDTRINSHGIIFTHVYLCMSSHEWN